MANFIERNQQRKEKRVLMNLYLRDCPRAEECPHEFVEVSTRLRPSFLFCREFGLLHLSRTKRRNWKRKGGAIVKPRKAEAENRLYRVPQQQLSLVATLFLPAGVALLDASDQ